MTIRIIILTWLPKLLCIDRPGKVKPPRRRTGNTSNPSPKKRQEMTNLSNKIKELEQLHAPRHAMSNLMDGDEDFSHLNARCPTGCHSYSNIDSFHTNLYSMQNRSSDEPDISAYNPPLNDSPIDTSCPQSADCERQLSPIFKELKFITNRMR
ncbi:unnamed protein product, partial [Medioppia subpectinata]